MLCREVLLISRANDWDLGFLQGILHKESCQLQQFQHITNEEYGYSPPTTVFYIPLINMNPADPDKILTSMYKVRQLTKEAGQKYTLFTNDQQLYCTTQQVTWWKPEE